MMVLKLMIMIAAAGGFEAGFESAAAVPGAPPGGQTREHAQLARSFGVDQLAVVVTKLDTCGYSEQRFHHVHSQLQPFLRQCGFRDSSVQWVAAVGPEGQNLTQPPTEPQFAAWYKVCCAGLHGSCSLLGDDVPDHLSLQPQIVHTLPLRTTQPGDLCNGTWGTGPCNFHSKLSASRHIC